MKQNQQNSYIRLKDLLITVIVLKLARALCESEDTYSFVNVNNLQFCVLLELVHFAYSLVTPLIETNRSTGPVYGIHKMNKKPSKPIQTLSVYRQYIYTKLFIFRFVFQHCLRSTLRLLFYYIRIFHSASHTF